VYCSEDVTVVFEAMTSPNSINRDCSASFMIINSSNYVYDYLPAGSASTRKPITVNLKQGKSFVEITASSASAILLISTVNGKPHSAMPLTLFANN
ncbi:MAG: hypothetical protein LUF04_02580, partial [Bacteroides sp.]|nr:hypothetical protein [Bacteroides sp.]